MEKLGRQGLIVLGPDIELPYRLLIGAQEFSYESRLFIGHPLAEDNDRLSHHQALVVHEDPGPFPQGHGNEWLRKQNRGDLSSFYLLQSGLRAVNLYFRPFCYSRSL